MAVHKRELNLGFKEYRAKTEFVSISELKSFEQSPYSYFKRYIEKIPDPNSKKSALQFGTLCHTLILEPEKFKDEYYVSDVRKDDRTKAYQEVQSLAQGKSIISSAELARAEQCANSSRPFLEDFTPLTPEVSYFYEGKLFKTPVKARFDGWCDGKGIILDVKTTSDLPTAENMSKTILNFKYHMQVAFYMDIHKAVTGEAPKAFHFLFQQTEHPYATSNFKCSRELIEIGREEYKTNLAKLFASLKDKRIENFPKMARQPEFINLPEWYLAKLRARLTVKDTVL